MKIKMLTLSAGPDGVLKAGQIVDLPTAEAEALIAGGYAEKVEAAVKAEGSSTPRKAVQSRGRTAAKTDAEEEVEEGPKQG